MLIEYNKIKEKIKKSWSFCGIYCVSYKKNTVNKHSSVRKSKQNSLMLLSNCVLSGNKKVTYIRNQELHQAIFDNFNNSWND